MRAPSVERSALGALLLIQTVLFLLLPALGSVHSWTVLSSFSAEIGADLLGAGESPLDGYDGIAAGPLLWAAIEAPLMAVLGRVGLVHVLATLLVALGATFASWLCARELLDERSALVVAALVALPPPNTWVHQHYGAYHVIPLLTAPLGFWVLLRARRLSTQIIGIAIIGSSVAWSLGAVSVVGPLVGGWWWTRRRGVEGRRALLAIAIGGLIAALPLLVKTLIHKPYAGLLPDGISISSATKPFLLKGLDPLSWPDRLVELLFVGFPYGHHFGLHGFPSANVLYAGIAVLAWMIAVRDGRLGPWLAVPPGVAIVGMVTGWFVFHPGDEMPFERDARHMVGLSQALAFAIGSAFLVLRRDESRVVRRALAAAGVAVLLFVSLGSQVRAVRAAWAEGSRPVVSTPFRLESRYVSGFFRGPHFASTPELGVQSCEALPLPLSADCQRGLAMALGFGEEEAPNLRMLCSEADVASSIDLTPWCWFGQGWGQAQRTWRQLVRASAACGATPGITTAEIWHCRRGVGWGTAQDFADRPDAIRTWITELPAQERHPVSEGVGIYAGMLAATHTHAARVCGRLVPTSLLPHCIRGTSLNDGFMAPLR